MSAFGPRFPNPCPVCGADDEHAAWRAAHPFNGIGATYCPHPGAGLGHGTGCCCGGLPESQPVPAVQPPAADMRYDDEDADEVARVFVRVEWKGGKVREYEAAEPQAFVMNDPESEMPRLAPMRVAVQGSGGPWVPVMAAVPELRLSFRANPRHNMHIRTERTAAPSAHQAEVNVSAVVQGEASRQVTAYPGIPSPKSGSDDAGRSGALSTVSSTEHMGLEPDKPA